MYNVLYTGNVQNYVLYAANVHMICIQLVYTSMFTQCIHVPLVRTPNVHVLYIHIMCTCAVLYTASTHIYCIQLVYTCTVLRKSLHLSCRLHSRSCMQRTYTVRDSRRYLHTPGKLNRDSGADRALCPRAIPGSVRTGIIGWNSGATNTILDTFWWWYGAVHYRCAISHMLSLQSRLVFSKILVWFDFVST